MFFKFKNVKIYHHLLIVLFVTSANAIGKEAFELVGVSTPPGEKNAYIATEGNIKLPVTVINGREPGPVLLLAAGTHGDEFPSMFALQLLAKELSPTKVKGTIVFLHLANLDGFHGRSLALNPKDNKNLNREFPGNKHGTPTEQIADLLTREFIERIDFFVDMHSGSANQTLLNHVYSPYVGDDKLDALTFEFAKATGMQHIIMYGDRPRDPSNSISFPNTAMTRGKPGLTTEIGHLTQRDEESIHLAKAVAMNALYYLDMLPGEAKPHAAPIIYQDVKYSKAHYSGFFTPLVKVGDNVSIGSVLGEVRDYFGNLKQTLNANVEGIVLMINVTPPIEKGESPVAIGVVE